VIVTAWHMANVCKTNHCKQPDDAQFTRTWIAPLLTKAVAGNISASLRQEAPHHVATRLRRHEMCIRAAEAIPGLSSLAGRKPSRWVHRRQNVFGIGRATRRVAPFAIGLKPITLPGFDPGAKEHAPIGAGPMLSARRRSEIAERGRAAVLADHHHQPCSRRQSRAPSWSSRNAGQDLSSFGHSPVT